MTQSGSSCSMSFIAHFLSLVFVKSHVPPSGLWLLKSKTLNPTTFKPLYLSAASDNPPLPYNSQKVFCLAALMAEHTYRVASRGSTPLSTRREVTSVKSSALRPSTTTRFDPEGPADDAALLCAAFWAVEACLGPAVSDEDPLPRIAARTLGGASAGSTGASIFRDLSGWSIIHFMIWRSLRLHIALYILRLHASL